jgi:phosphoenolpyruvate---glycerone phosphotransferase subunit DhaL
MTDYTLDAARFTDLLTKVARDLLTHTEELRQLDSYAGDGDLGITVELASKALESSLKMNSQKDLGKLLINTGMSINNASPSTFGTLLAMAFLGAGKVLVGKEEISIKDLGEVGEGAIEGIKKRGKSEVGDKTLLDTLVPAVKTFKEEMAKSGDLQRALKLASQAAEDGMKATIQMPAKFGRASWRTDHSVGLQDGGATATYYLISSFINHLLFMQKG